MAEVLLNQEQIKEIIPHRDPFLLIDEVLEMEVGKRVVARKYIKADDFWFKGHFPEKPVTPGVLMIDNGWQENYGVWRFHGGRFPDPHGMMNRNSRARSLCSPASTRRSSAARWCRAMCWIWK